METGLKDRVIIVTGASKGMGRATANAFAAEGAKLGICRSRSKVPSAGSGRNTATIQLRNHRRALGHH
jgi:NAD(P)-dependent dehydrogenase (short-subunit alcohol dehydrogenase family)